MDPNDSDGEEAFDSGDENEGFAIGTVVFPVDRDKEIVDLDSVLINAADSYIGRSVGQVRYSFYIFHFHIVRK